MTITTIQVVSNSDRYHVSQNGVPVLTLLFGNGISQPYAKMNAESEAFKLAIKLMATKETKVKLLENVAL